MRLVAGRPVRRLAILALLVFSPAWAATDDTVARLGATRFTVSDLKDFMRAMDPQARRQALVDPKAMAAQIRPAIVRKALLEEAVAKNWQQRPDVAQQIAAARDAIVLKTYMASVSAVPAGYPSEQEIKSAYTLNRDKFLVPRQYHLAQIFIASLPGDKNAAAAVKKASDIAAKARAKGDRFAELARQNSQHQPSAAKGGDMGWILENKLQPDMLSRIAGLQKGDVSDPIHSTQGWHIIRLLDTRPAAPRTLAEVKPLIITALRQAREQELAQLYLTRMLDKAHLVVDQARLGAVR